MKLYGLKGLEPCEMSVPPREDLSANPQWIRSLGPASKSVA